MRNLFFIMPLVISLISCNPNNNEDHSLSQIESIITFCPDSALVLLDSLKISSYNLYDQNRFFLYRVWAKDLAKRDISMDKEVLDVYSYFEDISSEELAGLASLYAGRVLHENKEYDKAIKYYNISENNAKAMNDKELQSYSLFWMGMLMLDQYMFEDAKEKFSEAKSLFIETQNYEYEIKLLKNIGVNYLLVDSSDSSLLYFNKALDLAMKYNKIKEQAQITQNIGAVLNENKNYKEAVRALKKAIQIDCTAHKSGRVYLNLAKSYFGLGMIDSTRYYANYCLHWAKGNGTLTSGLTSSIYALLSQTDEKNNNYKDALENHKIYSSNLADVLTENKNIAIIEAEKKFKFEAMQKDNIALSLKHLETQRFVILLLLFIAVLTIFYYNLLLRKNKQLTKSNDEIVTLTEALKDFDVTKENYRDNLIQNFNVLKRATSLEYFVQDTGNKQGKALIKRFNEIAYGKEMIDWDILYNIINSVNSGIFDKLKAKYTDLDETDFRICCLIYSKFNSNEIAVITQLSINTVHMKTTNIRKKLGIEKYGNIVDFLNKNLIT